MAPLSLHHPSGDDSLILDGSEISEREPLLVEVLAGGALVYELPTIEKIREMRDADLARLDPGVRRLVDPDAYRVALSERLWALKQELIKSAEGNE